MKKRLTKIFLSFLMLALISPQINAQTRLLFEDFERPVDFETPPQGWANVQYYTTFPATDKWRFDNPGGRRVSGNISGTFAIFDSENYSNNATLEDIGLESPRFSTIGHDRVFLSFDFAGEQSSTALAMVNIEAFDGAVWRSVDIYNDTTTSGASATYDISSLVRNTCGVQVRFRFYCQSGGWFAVDNVHVYSPDNPVSTNVQLGEMVTPRPNGCADPNARISVRIKNAGTSPVSNIPMFATVFDGVTTQNQNFTLTSTLGVCADTVITFPNTINITYDSAFRFVIYSALSGDQVRVNSDTTTVNGFKNLPSPLFFPDLDSIYCGNVFMIDSIPISGDQTAKWYFNKDDDQPFLQGPKIVFGNLNSDTTVYLETGFKKEFSAPLNSSASVTGGAAFNPGAVGGIFLDVTAKTDIFLDSLEVKVRITGSFEYEIWITDGTYVDKMADRSLWRRVYTGNTSAAPGRRIQIYTGAIPIPNGKTIGIYIRDKTNINNINGSGMEVYGGVPHIINNSQISTFASHYIQQNPAEDSIAAFQTLTAFGYNLNVYYRLECEGTFSKRTYRKPVPRPQTAIDPSSPFQARAEALRDIMAEGRTVSYEMPAPFGYTNNDFGTKWNVTSLTFKTINGADVPASHYTITNQPPSGSNNLKLTYTAPVGWADSILDLRATVQNLDIFPFCDSPLLRRIFIAPTPEVGIQYTPACERNIASFRNQSKISSGFLSYVWYFGDGDSSTVTSPTHVYNRFGTYNVRLVATSNLGIQKDTTIAITVLETPVASFSVPNRCEGFNFQVENNTVFTSGTFSSFWNLGDGKTSTSRAPNYTYANTGTYLVKLVVTADNGCKDSADRETTMFATPKANFQESDNNVCAEKRIFFQNTTQLNIGRFGSNWNFGSQGASNQSEASFKFNGPGTYPVRLIVESEFGCRDTITKPIVILESPIVDFTSVGNCINASVNFNNATIIPQGSVVQYQWNFNNEGNATDENPVYQFQLAGTKHITLNASLNNGCAAQITKTLTMNAGTVSDFNIISRECNQLQFVNKTPLAAGSVTYEWTFGDGNSSTLKNPNHTYTISSPQNVNVTLRTSVNGNCPSEATQQVNVGPVPVCNFTIDEIWIPGHRGFQFTPQRTGYSNYRWSFGDGTVSNEESPSYQYRRDGNFSVRLTVTTAEGCECTQVVENKVFNLSTSHLNEGSSVKLSPNPTNDFITVNLQLNSELMGMSIVDFTGKEVKVVSVQKGADVMTIDVRDLSAGIYFLRTQTANGVMNSKFVVNK
jgi:PKD repeat protein